MENWTWAENKAGLIKSSPRHLKCCVLDCATGKIITSIPFFFPENVTVKIALWICTNEHTNPLLLLYMALNWRAGLRCPQGGCAENTGYQDPGMSLRISPASLSVWGPSRGRLSTTTCPGFLRVVLAGPHYWSPGEALPLAKMGQWEVLTRAGKARKTDGQGPTVPKASETMG